MPPDPETAAAPPPIERFDICHPALPAGLDGLTVLHLADTHTRRGGRTGRLHALIGALRETPVDLVALTGDFMDTPGDEEAGIDALLTISGAWRARLGAFGVFGNHDTPAFQRLARRLDRVRWIGGELVDAPTDPPLRLAGLDWPEDTLALALRLAGAPPAPFTLVLAHVPTVLIPLAGLGLPLALAGHTHGGQIRLSPRYAPHTSSDAPPHLASGALRLGGTLCCVSRGLGDGVMEGLRFNCPRQAPLYTLRRGPLAGEAGPEPRQVIPW